MKHPFPITFDFALDDSKIIIVLTAIVELNEEEGYYTVHSFHSLLPDAHPSVSHTLSLLPDQQIKPIMFQSERLWVHRDSERESQLSRIIGKAIDTLVQEHAIKN